MPDPIVNQGGPGVTMGPAGLWLDAGGDVASTDDKGNPQMSPGMRADPSSIIYYDAVKDLNYIMLDGQKHYQSPSGLPPGTKGSGHGMHNPSGSLMKTGGTWNAKTGTFDQGHNWGNILSMVAAGIITMGTAAAIMGSAAPAGELAAAGLDTAETGTGIGAVGASAVGGVEGGFGIPAGLEGLGFAGDPVAGATIIQGAGLGAGGSALSAAQKIGQILGVAGKAVGSATTAAGNNALAQEQLALEAARINQQGTIGANNSNIGGQAAFESELMNRTKEEDTQRNTALKDTYRGSYVDNPRVSPFNPVGPPKYSQQYLDTVHNLSGQGATKLSQPGQYDTNNLPKLAPYTPITTPTIPITDVQGATGTKPGLGQKIGQYLGPGLTIAQLIDLYGSGGV